MTTEMVCEIDLLIESLTSAVLYARAIRKTALAEIDDGTDGRPRANGNWHGRNGANTKDRPLLDEATLSVIWRGQALHLGHTQGFWLLARLARMSARSRSPAVPRELIRLTEYGQLELYLTKFARGEFGLVLLLGRHGTGKSESVKRALAAPTSTDSATGSTPQGALIVEGHMQPFGLYRQLWDYRNQPIVLDDLDRLYADPDCVRLLKPLCNTVREKRLYWLTHLTLNDGALPPTFTTASNVILIANEWKSMNSNVRALEDRAIILHFCPSNEEVHRKVGQWFDDSEVYEFLGRLLPVIPAVSMRHYCKGSQLRRAGFSDWRSSLLQMIIPDRRMVCVIAAQHDPELDSEQQRVVCFVAMTGASRATYFRIKAKLTASGLLEGHG